MNFQEQFYEVMSRLRTNSRAASTPDARVTEMVNGLLVTKPAPVKKEPVVMDLQEYSRSGKAAAASVQGINKLKVIRVFQFKWKNLKKSLFIISRFYVY